MRLLAYILGNGAAAPTERSARQTVSYASKTIWPSYRAPSDVAHCLDPKRTPNKAAAIALQQYARSRSHPANVAEALHRWKQISGILADNKVVQPADLRHKLLLGAYWRELHEALRTLASNPEPEIASRRVAALAFGRLRVGADQLGRFDLLPEELLRHAAYYRSDGQWLTDSLIAWGRAQTVDESQTQRRGGFDDTDRFET
ncbi:MAG: hypothetical protein AAF654_05135 [Myxococcota bacterium]